MEEKTSEIKSAHCELGEAILKAVSNSLTCCGDDGGYGSNTLATNVGKIKVNVGPTESTRGRR